MNLELLTETEQDELLLLLESQAHDAVKTQEQKALDEEKRKLEASFSAFAKAAWETLEPGVPLTWSWHYDLIAEYLTLCMQKKLNRLIINIPPRTLKSTLITIMFPVWVWIQVQAAKGDTPPRSLAGQSFVCASYAQLLSEEHSVKRRRLIESAWFRSRWGDRVWLQRDQNQKSKFQNNFNGQMFATSVGGTLTGIGGNFAIIDDSLKPDEIASEPAITALHNWFTNTLRSRLNNPAEDVIIIVEQRSGEFDLTGFCEDADTMLKANKQTPEWTKLCIPLEADAEAVDSKTLKQVFRFPISKKNHARNLGDVLQPGRFPPAVVNAWKILRIIWNTQYQGRPSPLEGNMIRKSDIMYYGGKNPVTGEDDRDLPERFDLIVTSTDATFKDTESSDFVCVGTVGVRGPDRYVLEVVTAHLDSPATEKEINRQRLVWKARINLIEDKANGPAVIASMRKKVPGIVAVNPEGGKVSRMYAICGEWQTHNWYVSRTAAWSGPYVQHLCKFPAVLHDDDVDMTTQAGVYLQARGFRNGLVQWIQRQEAEAMAKRTGRNGNDHPIPPGDDLVSKVNEPKMAKVQVGEDTLSCQNVVDGEICGNTLMQRISGGWRCAQCGHQRPLNANAPPDPNQFRKIGWSAQR